jgi:hypothetical protein
MQDKEDVPTQSQKEPKLNLVVPSLQNVSVPSIQNIPTEVDDANINIQEFHSPQQECQRRQ